MSRVARGAPGNALRRKREADEEDTGRSVAATSTNSASSFLSHFIYYIYCFPSFDTRVYKHSLGKIRTKLTVRLEPQANVRIFTNETAAQLRDVCLGLNGGVAMVILATINHSNST